MGALSPRLPPRWRKAALTTHVAASVGWLGAVTAFLALAVAWAGTTSAGPGPEEPPRPAPTPPSAAPA